MLDFKSIKEIRMVDVCGRYKIALKFRGDYANAPCPLPTHKDGDKGKSFSINLAGNYWRCFSDSCNANNGGKKGGDVINFVAAMEKCREKEAAQKLADWFNVGQTKTPQRMAEGSVSPIEKPNQKTYEESTSSDSGVKYMATIDVWFEDLFKRGDKEADIEYWKRVRNGIKAKLVESFRSGKALRGDAK